MLFIKDLLKFKTTFGKLWLAGTVGVKRRPFNKYVIENSNIEEFVIALFNVEVPLSPRLSGTFLRGICAIYEQKFHLLQLEVQTLFRRLYHDDRHQEKHKQKTIVLHERARRGIGAKRAKKVVGPQHEIFDLDVQQDLTTIERAVNQWTHNSHIVPLTQLALNGSRDQTPARGIHDIQCTSGGVSPVRPHSHLTTPINILSTAYVSNQVANDQSQIQLDTATLRQEDELLDENALYMGLVHEENVKPTDTCLSTPRNSAAFISQGSPSSIPRNTINVSRTASHLSIRRGSITFTDNPNAVRSGNTVNDILRVSRAPRMKHTRRVGMTQKDISVKYKNFDRNMTINDMTLTLWKRQSALLLRTVSPQSALDPPNMNVGLLRSVKDPGSRVIRCLRSLLVDIHEIPTVYINSPRTEASVVSYDASIDAYLGVKDNVDHSILKDNSHRFTTIEKLRGVTSGRDSTTADKENNQLENQGNVNGIPFSGVDFSTWRHRAVIDDNRLSLMSGYVSDAPPESTAWTDNTLFDERFSLNDATAMSPSRYAMKNYNIARNSDAFFLAINDPFVTERDDDDDIYNKSLRLFESVPTRHGEAVGGKLLNNEGSPMIGNNPFLPLSIETSTSFFHINELMKSRSKADTEQNNSEVKIMKLLEDYFTRSLDVQSCSFHELVHDLHLNVVGVAQAFYSILPLATTGRVVLNQTTYDGSIIIALASPSFNEESCNSSVNQKNFLNSKRIPALC